MIDEGKEGRAGKPGRPGGAGGSGREGGPGGAGGPGGRGGLGGRGEAGEPGAAGGPGGVGGGGGARGAQGPEGPRGPAANEGVSYWRQTGVIPRWQLLGVYVLVVAAGMAGITRTQQVAGRADELSKQNKTTAAHAAALAREVADQRRESIRGSCEDSNTRHDRTIATLDRLLRRVPPAERQQARARRASTILLIDALAPKRDCEKVVQEATGG